MVSVSSCLQANWWEKRTDTISFRLRQGVTSRGTMTGVEFNPQVLGSGRTQLERRNSRCAAAARWGASFLRGSNMRTQSSLLAIGMVAQSRLLGYTAASGQFFRH